ncbi:trigger factor [Anaerosacchariphilus polymeriproducens]|uniref:peptidylprolyl isomerase n=1 Tax=Anaerosacchariphilus polymeriproducens TaxID=1812858 RepID=A0A371AWW7_9FIRM|nr:trigger factor [Anaerosacchariphilus polymeriproducens]RDU23970.1 trigger factor [Anaerosacchariphilus polymeriproducens]
MKKKVLLGTLAICIAATMVGCGEKVVKQKDKDYKVSEYVTLGEYKGIKAEKPEVVEVTDEEIQNNIDYDLMDNRSQEKITDRAVQEGDTVNINCSAIVDGKEYEEGSFEEYDLEIGAGDFFEGFESGLVGAKIGDEVELNLKFPDDYDTFEGEIQSGDEEGSESVAGKPVQFKVKINSISVYTTPELTDEFVKKNTEYKTVDEYKKGLRKSLEEQNKKVAEDSAQESVFEKVMENAKVDGYPEELYNEYYDMVKSSYEEMAEQYGMDMGVSEEDIKEEVIMQVQECLVLQMIAEKEKIDLYESEYDKGLKELFEENSENDESLKKPADLEESYGKEEIAEELLFRKVKEFLVSKAEIKIVTIDEFNNSGSEVIETEDEAAEEEMIEEEENAPDEIDENDIQKVE